MTTPQIEMFEPEQEDEDDEWFDYDSCKPASLMSVHDHVFLELMKARLASGDETWENITRTHEVIVDWTLGRMGYDT